MIIYALGKMPSSTKRESCQKLYGALSSRRIVIFLVKKSKKLRQNADSVLPPWWRVVDSNYRSRMTTDLQSAPFGQLGKPSMTVFVELVMGLEPATY
jgi:hypothetical protein